MIGVVEGDSVRGHRAGCGIMRIFDAIWTFRYHGCSRRISEGRSSGTALRPTAESISPCTHPA